MGERGGYMKCVVCDDIFNSFKWYELDNYLNSNLVICDNCILSLYKGKKRVLEGDIKELEDKIRDIERYLV